MERMIAMRDGVQLFTAIYIPKDISPANTYPFLMERTPYGCAPYGVAAFPRNGLGPNSKLLHEKYIFVYQDVRGRYKSQGNFEEMTPHIANKKSSKDVDESSDAYDTVDWLLKNVSGNNGNVGLYGVSYPGFYATASLPNAHPAIKAVSPQAPVTDEFIGDDANHNGAFFLLDNFSFMNSFGGKRTADSTNYIPVFKKDRIKDVYEYFLQMGGLKNTNSTSFYNNDVKIWNEYLAHDTYDDYWKARNIRPHLKSIKPAVLVVGGWFDAEDMFGALHTYEAIEQQSKANNNHLLMGPWTHGAWGRADWSRFGSFEFGANVNTYFEKTETDFFNFYLKGKGSIDLKEATMFNTGTNEWKQLNKWPPANTTAVPLFLGANGKMAKGMPMDAGTDVYTSDPGKPVPYISGISSRRQNEYLVDDQHFAAQRPDVLAYQTDILTEDITVAGRIRADLFVSLQSPAGIENLHPDADFIVKVIDVLPDTMPSLRGITMAGFQRMIRAEVFRGKFRKSFEKPEAFVPGKTEEVAFDLNDMLHTFKKGHRIMVQVQSSWFPIIDRNPQQFMKIPNAEPGDFKPLEIRLHHKETRIILPVATNL
ncbi:MAG: CocE/NonD family hydrolase [Chitinophagaceae bacterium]